MSARMRIVSLVPSTTESVCSLGAAALLVGCTRYCVHPRSALGPVARVGGTKNPDREGVMRLAPTLVLCNREENRQEDIDWFASRLPVVVQSPTTVRTAVDALLELGERLDRSEAARQFAERIEQRVHSVAPPGAERVPTRVFYAVWCRPWMSISRETFVHDVLRIAGVSNVCADLPSRYPEVSLEWLRAHRVDIVLLPSEPWQFDENQRAELARDGAFGTAALALCDGRDFCWHGTHMAEGIGNAVAAIERARPLRG